MAATTLFSTPISVQHNPSFNKSPQLPLIRASTSTTSTTVEEEENTQSKSIPLGGCKACGKAAIEKGCNGEGRIQGGIATVPGFGWWPIKAYRPCPDFVATGGRYRRQGQSMDEVAGFGTVPRTSTTAAAAAETQSRLIVNTEAPSEFGNGFIGIFVIQIHHKTSPLNLPAMDRVLIQIQRRPRSKREIIPALPTMKRVQTQTRCKTSQLRQRPRSKLRVLTLPMMEQVKKTNRSRWSPVSKP